MSPIWSSRARDGRPRAVARLISLVENDSPVLREVAAALAADGGHAQVVGPDRLARRRQVDLDLGAGHRAARGRQAGRGAGRRPVLAVLRRRAARRPGADAGPRHRRGRVHPVDGLARPAGRAVGGGAAGAARAGRRRVRHRARSRRSASGRPRSRSPRWPTPRCSSSPRASATASRRPRPASSRSPTSSSSTRPTATAPTRWCATCATCSPSAGGTPRPGPGGRRS